MIKLRQRGDTIVEVLLAIAVLSAVLGAAFVSVNNSFNGTRRSEERGEATRLVEAQFESLKEAAKDPTKNIFGPGPNPFCLDLGLNKTTACTNGRYTIQITRTGNTFVAVATWEQFGGGGQDQVRMTYRVYDET